MTVKLVSSILLSISILVSGSVFASEISDQLDRQNAEYRACLMESEKRYEAAKAKELLRKNKTGAYAVGAGEYQGCGDNGCAFLCFMMSDGRAECVNKERLGWYPGRSRCR